MTFVKIDNETMVNIAQIATVSASLSGFAGHIYCTISLINGATVCGHVSETAFKTFLSRFPIHDLTKDT